MRLAYLTGLYAWGGDTFIRDEVAELRDLGYHVETFSIRRPDPASLTADARREFDRTDYILDHGFAALLGAAARQLRRSPSRFVEAARVALGTTWPGARGRLWPVAYLLEACYVAERLREARCEHVHNHIGEGAGTVTMLAAMLAEIPFSITFHGPTTFDHPRELALDVKVKHSAFTVAISEFARSQVWRWVEPADQEKVHVVPCGVRTTFLGRPVVRVPDSPRLVSVGRLTIEKGHAVLLRALARARASGHAVELVLVGDGDQRDALDGLAVQLGLSECVRFAGWLPPEQVAEELGRARALVLPSFAEGLPVTIMEAYAMHRPVIATAVGGISELVDAKNGWLVPPGSVASLATSIEAALAAPPEDLLRMGRVGAERVAERHDARRQAKALAGLIAAALA